MNKWHFLTFGAGTEEYRRAANRLQQQGERSKFFHSSHVLTETDLETLYPEFIQEHSFFIENNSRGYGYWIWKPYLILKRLEELPEGDGLLYLDAGCVFNFGTFRSRFKMREYFRVANKTGSLAFQLNKTEGWPRDLTEAAWTKQRVLDLFHLSEEDKNSNQIQATCLFITRNDRNINFLREWFNKCVEGDYVLVSDEDSISNYPLYNEHRHDQSILSCMYKSEKRSISNDQIWFSPNWTSDGKNFPIWAMRYRNG